MKKKLLLTKTLLIAFGLFMGSSVAWATIYQGTSNQYDIVFGTPTYTDEVVTGVGVQTDFTTDNATGHDLTNKTLKNGGLCACWQSSKW